MNVLAASAVDLGAIGQWVAVVAVLAVVWRVNRGGGGAALDSLDKANAILERRITELDKQAKADARTVAELQARTDFALALAPILEGLNGHELRAEQRHSASLRIMQLVADRLGPEPNGAHHHE